MITMKNRLLVVLLSLSLAGNFFLFLLFPEPVEPAPSREAPAAAVVPFERSEAAAPLSPQREASQTQPRGQLVELAERLRSHGMPEEVIQRVAAGVALTEWAERRHELRLAIDRAIDTADFAEANRLELEERALCRDFERQLIALGVEVEVAVPWVLPMHQIMPRDWSPAKRFEMRWTEEEVLRPLVQQSREFRHTVWLEEDGEAMEAGWHAETAAKEKLFSPVEAREYNLLYGPRGWHTRERMRHSQMTPEEGQIYFRKTAEFLLQHQETFEADEEAWATLEPLYWENLTEHFGPERTEQIRMEEDERFVTAADVAQRFGLPREVAEEVYRIESMRRDEVTNLPPERKAEFDREVEELIAEKMGEGPYQAYRKNRRED